MTHTQDPERSLLLGVLTQAILDLPDDGVVGYDWFLGDGAAGYMSALGMSPAAQFALRLRLLLGLVPRSAFDARPLHAARYGYDDKRMKHAAETTWQSWPALAR